jgi:arylsulfatase
LSRSLPPRAAPPFVAIAPRTRLALVAALVLLATWLPTLPALPATPRAAEPASSRRDAAAPAAAPAAVPTPPRPNLVLVTLDTTRADHLGCYGYPRPTSPTIDALAQESVVFERCHAVLPHTTPSHASIFTGVYPYEHGVLSCSFRASVEDQERRAFAPTERFRSYAQMLADAGWHTGGFVTAATTKKITGLGLGFAAWSEPEAEVCAGDEAAAHALEWLADVPEPFFLWLHLFDAHAPPREKHVKWVKEFAVDAALKKVVAERAMNVAARSGRRIDRTHEIVRYDAGIRMMDDHVRDVRARIVERGAWERTTFVVTGDHGEGLGQHGVPLHGPVWQEQVRVPFLLKAPGLVPARVSTLVSSIDVLATAIAQSPGLPSEEFLAQARGGDALAVDFEERPVFSMSPPQQREHALTSGRYRLIRRQRAELHKEPLSYEFVHLATRSYK